MMETDQTPFLRQLDAAAERVGDLVFRAMFHVAVSGAPKTPEEVRFALDSDELDVGTGLAATVAGSGLSAGQERSVAEITMAIEHEAKLAIISMFGNADFRARLASDAVAGRAKRLALDRMEAKTVPFLIALRRNPAASTKELLREMEALGELIDPFDKSTPAEERTCYLLRDGTKIGRAGIAGKISRLRVNLRNA